MPIELSLEEISERLGNPNDPVFKATIATVLHHAEDGNAIKSRFVQVGNGYVRKFEFTLESEVPKRTYYVSEDGRHWE
jgi:hypothetical protein